MSLFRNILAGRSTSVRHHCRITYLVSRGMRSANDSRIQARGDQTRSWAAPMPAFGQIPPQTARTRLEWDTRDTANNRLFQNMQVAGAKTVTSAMLAEHPTRGAEPFMPTVSKYDTNQYSGASFYPDSSAFPSVSGQVERPRLPRLDSSNPFLASLDTECPETLIREIKHSVVEDTRFRKDDVDSRIINRVFTDRLIPTEMRTSIVERQVAASELFTASNQVWEGLRKTGPSGAEARY